MGHAQGLVKNAASSIFLFVGPGRPDFFSDPDWVTGAVGLAPDGSVAIASSTGDPPKLLFSNRPLNKIM